MANTDVEKGIAVSMEPKSRLIKLNDQRDGADSISPGLRAMLVTLRAALLMAADAIAGYLDIDKRVRERD